MLKKILLIIGNLFAGLNIGILSAFTPVLLVIEMIIFGDEFLSFNVLAVNSLIAAVITGLVVYLYAYGKKREHDYLNVNFMVFTLSIVTAAIIMCVFCFIGAGNEIYDLTV